MTYQPGEPPSYAQPQDPWSAGSASPPTDPIPAPARGQYAPGVAAPMAPAPNVWAQETVVQGYGGGRGSGGGRTGLYVLITIVVLVLGGAGGAGAWYLIKERLGTQTPGTQTSTQAQPSTSQTGFVPSAVRVGDCLLNLGTQERPDMVPVSCENSAAMRVLKIQNGDGILHNAQGKFDTATANSICLGVEGWDGAWFGWNSQNNALDYFYCLDDLSA